jgi:hypothetical protein
MDMEDYKNSNWWRYAQEEVRDLVEESIELLASEKSRLRQGSGEPKHDYAFVVFPAAKGYEGFLKKVFLDMRLISLQQYNGDYFRIGKVLNPNLPKRYRSGWVFGRLVESSDGEALPMRLWQVWSRARNKIFHFFPHHREFITLKDAEQLVEEIILAMEMAVERYEIK